MDPPAGLLLQTCICVIVTQTIPMVTMCACGRGRKTKDVFMFLSLEIKKAAQLSTGTTRRTLGTTRTPKGD